MADEDKAAVPRHLTPSQACVVYDRTDGRIIHIHEFIAADPSQNESWDELHAAAMEMASKLSGTENLAVADVPDELVRGSRGPWRVDPSSGEVKAEQEPFTEQSYERRAAR